MQGKRVLWLHNWENKVGKGGVWMFNQYEYFESNVDLYYLDNLRNPLKLIKHYIKLRKLAKKYDVLHAQYGSAVGFITSLLPGSKVITLRGSDWYSPIEKSFINKLRTRIGNSLTRKSLNRFDSIIVVSERMKSDVLKTYSKASNIYVLPTPIDLKKFYPIEIKRNSTRKKIMFATVDINNKLKRYDLAKESFSMLEQQLPDIEFVVMNNIPHNKVNNFINGVDLILLTSTYEGWPNVIKETLACNVPFVATDVSDLKLFANQTKSCFVCSDSPKELAEKMKESLSFNKKENLRNLILPFNIDSFVYSLYKVYSNVINSTIHDRKKKS